ncbi:hypothetical protein [Hydrocarboniphaga effusa]|uniref:hypothetical protein n=1 Tax=Hydrocarboniphaga effusa TaxID=243629 RepID=UPI00398BFDC1
MQALKLQDLLGAGVVISDDVVNEKVLWTREDGELVEFDIFVKREMSAADYEFIFLGLGEGSEDKSWMARRVHRMVKMASGEAFPMSDVVRFKPDLLKAICDAINRVESPAKPPKA